MLIWDRGSDKENKHKGSDSDVFRWWVMNYKLQVQSSVSVKDKNVMDVSKYALVIQLFLHEKLSVLFIYKVPQRCAGFRK